MPAVRFHNEYQEGSHERVTTAANPDNMTILERKVDCASSSSLSPLIQSRKMKDGLSSVSRERREKEDLFYMNPAIGGI